MLLDLNAWPSFALFREEAAPSASPSTSSAASPGRGARSMSERREVGPRSREIVAREQQHIAPGSQSFSLYSGLAMARGQGCTLIDEDGNEYIDFIAGIGVGLASVTAIRTTSRRSSDRSSG